ncbi:hypothetical protein CDAR_485631 [Caerostris darwini]|uniref:Uncharacterized protein n=1 Tax=Caerostris darwini TaxID=1538125 RepID=A0AAV4QVV1_9ARAC|nr:hypothetical protein CDAR_485631 [Caerostris darwini]
MSHKIQKKKHINFNFYISTSISPSRKPTTPPPSTPSKIIPPNDIPDALRMTPATSPHEQEGEKQTLKRKSKRARNKPNKKRRAWNSKQPPHRNQEHTSRSDDAHPHLKRAPTSTEIDFRDSIISFHYFSSLLLFFHYFAEGGLCM